MEWFEWAFVLPIVGWLGREIWSNVSHIRFMRKESENEHLYFKKRLIFEQKHEVYKELYQKVKHMVGAFNTLNDTRSLLVSSQEAVNNYVNIKLANEVNFDSNKFVNQYNNNEIHRVEANYDYILKTIGEKKKKFNNYVAEQNYILSYEENVLLKELSDKVSELENYLYESLSILKIEDDSEKLKQLQNYFENDYYKNKFNQINNLTYDLSDTMRREMFL